MSASGVFKRVRLGDEVQAHCGRCKEERTHQIVALNSGGGIERVTCRTCQSTHLYRERQAAAKRASTRNARQPAAKSAPLSAANARPYSPQESYASGDVIAHPKFGLGEVVESRGGKIDVKFDKEKRTLLQAG